MKLPNLRTMSGSELRLELGYARAALIRVAEQKDGCLAQTYQDIAERTLKKAAARSEPAAANQSTEESRSRRIAGEV